MKRLLIAIAVSGLLGCSGGDGEPLVMQADTEPVPAPVPAPPKTTPEPPAPPKTTPEPPAPPKTTPPAPSVSLPVPSGVWTGKTVKNGRDVLGVVLPDGRLWFIYSRLDTPSWPGGVVAGTMTMDTAGWTVEAGVYLDRDTSSRATLTGGGTSVAKQELAGEFEFRFDAIAPQQPVVERDGVVLRYDARSTQTFSAAQDAGLYLGFWYPYEEVLIGLNTDGTLYGTTSKGCAFHGSVEPRGPVAEGEITFEGVPCENGYATVRGVLSVDRSTGTMYAGGFNTEKNRGFVFIGKR